jgi:hypothetical protein
LHSESTWSARRGAQRDGAHEAKGLEEFLETHVHARRDIADDVEIATVAVTEASITLVSVGPSREQVILPDAAA